jgi:hypothetical protein
MDPSIHRFSNNFGPVLLPHWQEIPGVLKHVTLKLPYVYFSISLWFGQLDLVTTLVLLPCWREVPGALNLH